MVFLSGKVSKEGSSGKLMENSQKKRVEIRFFWCVRPSSASQGGVHDPKRARRLPSQGGGTRDPVGPPSPSRAQGGGPGRSHPKSPGGGGWTVQERKCLAFQGGTHIQRPKDQESGFWRFIGVFLPLLGVNDHQLDTHRHPPATSSPKAKPTPHGKRASLKGFFHAFFMVHK